MKKFLKNIIFGLVAFVLLALAGEFGFLIAEKKTYRTPPACLTGISHEKDFAEADFSIFWEAWRTAENYFLDRNKIDYKKMVYGAVKGMIDSLGDPYTVFFDPKETDEFNEELSGKYEGVGMEVAIKKGVITVVAPLEGTPAEKAGLRPKDKIIKINGTLTNNLSLEKAVKLIRGPRGTTVTLLISRSEWETPREVVLKRALIKIPTLKWRLEELDSGKEGKEYAAYIKIYQFNRILTFEFAKAAEEILKSPAKKLILDVRNNPGGYLDIAQNISGWFLKKGDVVVREKFKGRDKEEVYRAKGPGIFAEYPAVVLINEGTASAAEILAGALRDNRGVKLVGESSFGKGSVQQQLSLSDGSSLKVTVARWFTPKGTSIDEKGLSPDIKVKMAEKQLFGDVKDDIQLKKALMVLKNL